MNEDSHNKPKCCKTNPPTGVEKKIKFQNYLLDAEMNLNCSNVHSMMFYSNFLKIVTQLKKSTPNKFNRRIVSIMQMRSEMASSSTY